MEDLEQSTGNALTKGYIQRPCKLALSLEDELGRDYYYLHRLLYDRICYYFSYFML